MPCRNFGSRLTADHIHNLGTGNITTQLLHPVSYVF